MEAGHRGGGQREHGRGGPNASCETIDYGITIVNTVGRGYDTVERVAAISVESAGCAGASDASAGAGRGYRGVPRSWVRGRHHPGGRGRGEGVRPDGGGAVRHQGPAAEGGDRCGDRRGRRAGGGPRSVLGGRCPPGGDRRGVLFGRRRRGRRGPGAIGGAGGWGVP